MRTKCLCCGRARANPEEKLCSDCIEKRNILRSRGKIFAGQPSPPKKQDDRKRIGLMRLYGSGYRPHGVYDLKHGMRIGVGTKRVVDFVNSTGGIHYGRAVAESKNN